MCGSRTRARRVGRVGRGRYLGSWPCRLCFLKRRAGGLCELRADRRPNRPDSCRDGTNAGALHRREESRQGAQVVAGVVRPPEENDCSQAAAPQGNGAPIACLPPTDQVRRRSREPGANLLRDHGHRQRGSRASCSGPIMPFPLDGLARGPHVRANLSVLAQRCAGSTNSKFDTLITAVTGSWSVPPGP